jgi:molybdate transport system ATP-binding protein
MDGTTRRRAAARGLSMLAIDVEKQLSEFHINAKFDAPDGVTALFGPSGSGKTSIVNMIAGLIRPDRGRVMCNDALLFDSRSGLDRPPHRRHIGYVFQDGRLFPHMTVAQNLDYGRRMYRLPRDEGARARVVAMLNIGHLLARRPAKLSGGERQRVAIGRALLLQPLLLLLDEPLASLDTPRKREIFPYLLRLRDERLPMIYVSHHAAELRRIATTIVRIESGQVIGIGGAELLDAADADAL